MLPIVLLFIYTHMFNEILSHPTSQLNTLLKQLVIVVSNNFVNNIG